VRHDRAPRIRPETAAPPLQVQYRGRLFDVAVQLANVASAGQILLSFDTMKGTMASTDERVMAKSLRKRMANLMHRVWGTPSRERINSTLLMRDDSVNAAQASERASGASGTSGAEALVTAAEWTGAGAGPTLAEGAQSMLSGLKHAKNNRDFVLFDMGVHATEQLHEDLHVIQVWG